MGVTHVHSGLCDPPALETAFSIQRVGSKAKGRCAGGGSSAAAAETLFLKSVGIKTQPKADLNFDT